MDAENRRAWWQVGRVLASLPLFAIAGFLLAVYALTWIVFPWNTEFITMAMGFLLCPALVLLGIGALIVGWRHILRTTAWVLTAFGLGALLHVGVLWVAFSLPGTVNMIPVGERVDTLALAHSITTAGASVGVVVLLVGLVMLARQELWKTV